MVDAEHELEVGILSIALPPGLPLCLLWSLSILYDHY
jgi:hypothetical protein